MMLRFGRRRPAGLAAALVLASVLALGLFGRAIPAASRAADCRQVPILMYHSLLRDRAFSGPYVLPPETLEADLAWLNDHGYTPTPLARLADFVRGEAGLPQKPVVITFDDGHLNNLTYLPDLLAAYDFCACVSVVGEYSARAATLCDPNPAYAYLTWDDIAALARNSRVEIGNHSYFAHSRLAGAGEAACERYGDALVEDAEVMARALRAQSGVDTRIYAYPYGFVAPGADDGLRALGFEITLGCAQRVNTVTAGDADCLFSMGRFNRPAGISTERFMRETVKLK